MGYYTVTKDKFPHSVTMSEYHKKKADGYAPAH